MIEQLEVAVIEWAKEKGILDAPDPLAQIEKFQEEGTELTIAVATREADTPLEDPGTLEAIKDGIGDVMVTMIIQAHIQGFTLGECLAHSYGIIAQRSGHMENGVFVKHE